MHILQEERAILGIETKLHEVTHPFLKKLYKVCIDGADPDTYNRIVDTEISFITERHNLNISLFTKMAGFSPYYGHHWNRYGIDSYASRRRR